MVRWLQRLWVLPIAMPIWIFYLLLFWGLGLIKTTGAYGAVVHFRMVPRWLWWTQLWDGWAGHALPFAIVTVPRPTMQTVKHELRHTEQWLKLGPLFPVVYLALLIAHGYKNHPLERDARAHEEE